VRKRSLLLCPWCYLTFAFQLTQRMKNLIPLFLAILMCQKLFSQQNKSTLAISIGPSFPVGNYSKTEADIEQSGYAAMGGAVSLSYAHRIGNGFSVVAMVGIQKNGTNKAAFEKQVSQSAFVIAPGPAIVIMKSSQCTSANPLSIS